MAFRSFGGGSEPSQPALTPELLKLLADQAADQGGGPGFFSQVGNAGLGAVGGVLDWLSHPGQGARSLLAIPGELYEGDLLGAGGRALDALEHGVEFGADLLTAGQASRVYKNYAGEDFTTRKESPEFTDLIELYAGKQNRPEGWKGFAADVVGGVATDPLTYLTLGSSAVGTGAKTLAGAGSQLAARNLLTRGLLQSTKGRMALKAQIGAGAAQDSLRALNTGSLRGLMESSLSQLDEAAEAVFRARVPGPYQLNDDFYRNLGHQEAIDQAVGSMLEEGLLAPTQLKYMGKRIPRSEKFLSALPGAMREGAAPAFAGEVAGGVLGLPPGVGAAGGVAARRLLPDAAKSVDDWAAEAWKKTTKAVFDKFEDLRIPQQLRETARQFEARARGANMEAEEEAARLFQSFTPEQRQAMFTAMEAVERLAPKTIPEAMPKVAPKRAVLPGFNTIDLGKTPLYRGERFAPLDLERVGTIPNVRRPRPWDFLRNSVSTPAEAAGRLQKAMAAMDSQDAVARALKGEFGDWQKKRLGMLRRGLRGAERLARKEPEKFMALWRKAEAQLQQKFGNKAFWASTSPRVAKAYQDQLAQIFGPELSSMFRRPEGTLPRSGLFKAEAELKNSLDLSRYGQGVIPESEAQRLALQAGLSHEEAQELVRFNRAWSKRRGQELVPGQLAVETLFRGPMGERLMAALEEKGFDSVYHVSWGFREPDVAVLNRGSLRSMEEVGERAGAGRRIDLRAAGASGGAPGGIAGEPAGIQSVRGARQLAAEVAAKQAGIPLEQAEKVFARLFQSFDRQQDELIKLGVWGKERRRFYVPHVMHQEVSKRFADAGLDPHETFSRFRTKDAHTGRRRNQTLREFEEAIRRQAAANGVSLEGIEELAVKDLGDLFLLRQVNHNTTMWKEGLKRHMQKYAGATARLDGDSAVDAYTRNLIAPMNARNKAMQLLAYTNRFTKPLQTIYIPAFHARNLVSTWFQPLTDLSMSAKDSAKIMVAQVADLPLLRVLSKPFREQGAIYKFMEAANNPLNDAAQAAAKKLKIGRYTGDQVLRYAKQGLLRNNFGEEVLEDMGMGVRTMREQTESNGPVRRLLNKIGVPVRGLDTTKGRARAWKGWLDKTASDVSAYVEDRARFVAFVGLLEKGIPAEEAIKRTGRMFVNYDVQSAVDRTLRDVVPYARFTVGNTPVALAGVARRPAIATPSVAASESVQREDPLASEESRMGFGVPLGEGRYLEGLGLPLYAAAETINNSTSWEGARRTLGQTALPLNFFGQKATGKNFYFGGDFDRPSAAPDWIPAVGPVRETAYGGKEFSPAFSQLLYSGPASRIAAIGRTLDEGDGSKILKKVFLGAGVRTLDEERAVKKLVVRWLEEAQRNGEVGKVANFYQRGLSAEAEEAVKLYLQLRRAERERRREP